MKSVTIGVNGLSHRWHGARIVQISDIHLGPTVGFSKLSRIVNVVNSLKPVEHKSVVCNSEFDLFL